MSKQPSRGRNTRDGRGAILAEAGLVPPNGLPVTLGDRAQSARCRRAGQVRFEFPGAEQPSGEPDADADGKFRVAEAPSLVVELVIKT